MNPTECERLAHAVNALRPDWPAPSLRTWIGTHLDKRAYRDAAVALVWVALDPATQKPARVLENGPWWGATLTAASEAERHPSAVKLGDLCDICSRHKDACEHSGTRPVPPAWKAQAEFASRRERNAAWVAKIREDLRNSHLPTTADELSRASIEAHQANESEPAHAPE